MAWGVPKLGATVEVASGDVALTEPASVAQGDLMIACIGYRSNAAFTLPSGWSLVATQQSSGDTDATNGIASGVMAYIVRGASAPALTFTRTAGDVAQGRIISYSGGHATAPYDTGSANTLASAAIAITASSITTAEAGELLVAMASHGDSHSSTSFAAATDPVTSSTTTDTTNAPTAGTWRERSDVTTLTGADNGLGIADAVRATAGATGQFSVNSGGSARHVMIVGAFTTPKPTVVLNSPADASSDADTTPTLDFTGTDTDGDSIEYNVQVDTVNTFDGSAIDSYSESNYNSNSWVNGAAGETSKLGQAFTGNGKPIAKATLYLKKFGSPTGNAVVSIYAVTGTYGTDAKPTGAALATSGNLDVSTLTTSFALIDFTFTGANQISLTSGTKYVLSVEYAGGDNSNKVGVGYDSTSPTHDGNDSYYTVTGAVWTGRATLDFPFYVYSPLLSKLSVTPDAGFVNPDTGGDTHPFNSGENIQYTVQAGDALAAGTYYWRVRGADTSGSNTYGAWATTRSFTVTAGGAANTTNFFQFMF